MHQEAQDLALLVKEDTLYSTTSTSTSHKQLVFQMMLVLVLLQVHTLLWEWEATLRQILTAQVAPNPQVEEPVSMTV
jgi:hypothetical protein